MSTLNTKQRYDDKIVAQLFLSLLPAQIFAALSGTLGNLINGIIIGNNLSSSSMAAVGLVGPLNAIIAALSMIVSGGTKILCSRYLGQGDIKKINESIETSINILLCLGILLSIIGFAFATQISVLLGASEVTIFETTAYIRGLSFGFIFALLTPCLMVFTQLKNDSNFTLISSVLFALFNFVLTFTFVKYLKMGIYGAGIATSLAQFFTSLLLWLKGRKSNYFNRLKLSINNELVKQICIMGCPAAIASILYPLRNIILNSLANKIGGESAVVALAILNSCGGLFDSFNIGVISTCVLLMALAVGEKNRDFFHNTFRYNVKIGLIIGFTKIFIIFLFSQKIASLFGATGTNAVLASDLLRYYSLSMPVNMIAAGLINTYQTTGKLKQVNILNLFSAFIIPVASAFILGNIIGVTGIWLCYLIPEIVIVLYFIIKSYIANKRFPNSVESLLMISDSLITTKSISFNVTKMDELSELSSIVNEFLTDQGVDSKLCYFGSLCVEETARNIIELAFPKDRKKNHDINVFVMITDDGFMIRLRDNAVAFNQVELINIYNPDNPIENIGIKMVSKLSKGVFYHITFGMNILTILF